VLQVPLAQCRSGYPVENIFECAEGKIVERWKVDMHADKRNRLLTQPPRKLAASATQVLCKCYWPKICVFAGLGGWGGSTNIRVHVTLSPHKKLDQSGFVQRRDNCPYLRVGRKVAIFIGGVVLPVLIAFFFLRPVGLPWTVVFCIVKWHMRICGMCFNLWRFLLLDHRQTHV
jgi:hypothetical protein